MTQKERIDDAKGIDGLLAPFLGKILLGKRKEKNFKQEELAKKIEINDATVRRIETGQGGSEDNIRKICGFLGLSYEEVVIEALFDLFRARLSEGSEQTLVRKLRDDLSEKIDAYQRSQRRLFDAYFELMIFAALFKAK
jgi:transcriptional regulator with XRE-family HTH domain